MEDQLRKSALDYHRSPTPGKISVTPTKELFNQRDLALAYTPGVAIVCQEIAANPAEARNLTARGSPMSTRRFRQASAAAPAPEATSLTLRISLPTTFRPFMTAAPTMMAVPCWSS